MSPPSATRPQPVASIFWYRPCGEFLTSAPLYEGEKPDSVAVQRRVIRSMQVLRPTELHKLPGAEIRVYPNTPAPQGPPTTRDPS